MNTKQLVWFSQKDAIIVFMTSKNKKTEGVVM